MKSIINYFKNRYYRRLLVKAYLLYLKNPSNTSTGNAMDYARNDISELMRIVDDPSKMKPFS